MNIESVLPKSNPFKALTMGSSTKNVCSFCSYSCFSLFCCLCHVCCRILYFKVSQHSLKGTYVKWTTKWRTRRLVMFTIFLLPLFLSTKECLYAFHPNVSNFMVNLVCLWYYTIPEEWRGSQVFLWCLFSFLHRQELTLVCLFLFFRVSSLILLYSLLLWSLLTLCSVRCVFEMRECVSSMISNNSKHREQRSTNIQVHFLPLSEWDRECNRKLVQTYYSLFTFSLFYFSVPSLCLFDRWCV